MRAGFCQQHTGTLPSLFLASIYALPFFSGNDLYLVDRQSLEEISYFETAAPIYGFMLAGFYFDYRSAEDMNST